MPQTNHPPRRRSMRKGVIPILLTSAEDSRISKKRRKLHGRDETYRRRIERRSDVFHRAARRMSRTPVGAVLKPPPALPRAE